MFVRSGVFQCPGDLQINSFQRYLWAFADADTSTNSDSLSLTERERKVFTIFTTSPQPKRWKPLQKNTLCLILTMNSWTWEEIREA
jgi:hypothetical protein